MKESRLAEEALKMVQDACAGYTQAEVARLTGVHQGTLSSTLRGVPMPKLETIERIMNGLGYDLELVARKRSSE